MPSRWCSPTRADRAGSPPRSSCAATSVKDPDTGARSRYIRQRSFGQQWGTQPLYLPHNELVLNHTPQYDSNFNITDTVTNQDDINQQSDYYLDAAEQQYQTTFPQTVSYVGIRGDIELDGAIQQVVLQISDTAGATTTASRNDEQVHKFPSYKERRELERVKKIKEEAAKQKPGNQRKANRVNKRKG